MPQCKNAKKSTDTDMTPFVDIAFLILSFFIMATKFKPQEPVKIETPGSVSSDILKEENSMLITIDPESRVFLNISDPKSKTKENDQLLSTGINTRQEPWIIRRGNSRISKGLQLLGFLLPTQRLFWPLLRNNRPVFKQPGFRF